MSSATTPGHGLCAVISLAIRPADSDDFHQSGTGCTAAEIALTANTQPVRGPRPLSLFAISLDRLPSRLVNCWMNGPIQQATPSSTPMIAQR